MDAVKDTVPGVLYVIGGDLRLRGESRFLRPSGTIPLEWYEGCEAVVATRDMVCRYVSNCRRLGYRDLARNAIESYKLSCRCATEVAE